MSFNQYHKPKKKKKKKERERRRRRRWVNYDSFQKKKTMSHKWKSTMGLK
jgi:hypothetical protein